MNYHVRRRGQLVRNLISSVELTERLYPIVGHVRVLVRIHNDEKLVVKDRPWVSVLRLVVPSSMSVLNYLEDLSVAPRASAPGDFCERAEKYSEHTLQILSLHICKMIEVGPHAERIAPFSCSRKLSGALDPVAHLGTAEEARSATERTRRPARRHPGRPATPYPELRPVPRRRNGK